MYFVETKENELSDLNLCWTFPQNCQIISFVQLKTFHMKIIVHKYDLELVYALCI